MNEKVLKSLYDIKLAIEEVDSYFVNKDKSFREYQGDIMLQRAIERNLEIIGEAMNRILKEDPGFKIKNSRGIVGLRNQIIHGYDSVSVESLWGVLINHLPNLKIEVEALIKGKSLDGK
ncbi:MAG TPA: HepT-like ribonuclease domain-containing protein [Bacteroidales bacterium]|nr:HepT-like ribonuclease domain-containing protein [Bacteroidales bacterium]